MAVAPAKHTKNETERFRVPVRLRPHTSHHNEEFVAQNGTRQISVVRRTLQYTRPPPATVRGTVPGAGPRVYTVLLAARLSTV